uniref:Uncharacterized protein n=1 Tax=Acrobeloides nanus TaxID=290746 RepID=A0A914DMK4_9BILA
MALIGTNFIEACQSSYECGNVPCIDGVCPEQAGKREAGFPETVILGRVRREHLGQLEELWKNAGIQ